MYLYKTEQLFWGLGVTLRYIQTDPLLPCTVRQTLPPTMDSYVETVTFQPRNRYVKTYTPSHRI